MSTSAVTLAEVAAAAGVHPSTVSRVISRPDLVKSSTVERVTASIERLGYEPNRAARQLAGGRTGRIGVLVPDLTNPFFAEIVSRIETEAGDRGDLVLVAGTGARSDLELKTLRSVAGSVDGVVVCSPVANTAEVRTAVGSLPLVYVNRRATGVHSVVVDQGAVIELGLAHLRRLGHERIAVALGPSPYWSTEQRRRAARRAGIVTIAPIDADHPDQALDEVRSNRCTAVMTFNDLGAFALVHAAHDAGVRVPDDLSVVGSDDVPFAAHHLPPLTTVDGDAHAVGDAAFASLARLVAGDDPPNVIIAPRLITRSSTGPAR